MRCYISVNILYTYLFEGTMEKQYKYVYNTCTCARVLEMLGYLPGYVAGKAVSRDNRTQTEVRVPYNVRQYLPCKSWI